MENIKHNNPLNIDLTFHTESYKPDENTSAVKFVFEGQIPILDYELLSVTAKLWPEGEKHWNYTLTITNKAGETLYEFIPFPKGVRSVGWMPNYRYWSVDYGQTFFDVMEFIRMNIINDCIMTMYPIAILCGHRKYNFNYIFENSEQRKVIMGDHDTTISNF